MDPILSILTVHINDDDTGNYQYNFYGVDCDHGFMDVTYLQTQLSVCQSYLLKVGL